MRAPTGDRISPPPSERMGDPASGPLDRPHLNLKRSTPEWRDCPESSPPLRAGTASSGRWSPGRYSPRSAGSRCSRRSLILSIWHSIRRVRAAAAVPVRRRYGYREVAKALGYASHGGVVTAVRRIESADAAVPRRAPRLEGRSLMTNMTALGSFRIAVGDATKAVAGVSQPAFLGRNRGL